MRLTIAALLAFAPLCLPSVVLAAGLTPGQYEYTIKMNMPGAPANLPTQTVQRCLSAKDVAGDAAFQQPPRPDSDCKMSDMNQSGSQFSYKVACTKPQKLDGTVKGTYTATGMTMDMSMNMPQGQMTQNITARRVGDCK
jgi:hypothetical protein